MKVILLDIEGTTTPIDFVHKILFPYAKQRMRRFVQEHWSELSTEIDQLKRESAVDERYGKIVSSADSAADYLEFLIDHDRKSTPLKSIQGNIWKDGYETGTLKSEIFDDVPGMFEYWKGLSKGVAIYSSGSVLAQKLLFAHTTAGDLTPAIDSYFDTNIGSKMETGSYKRIVEELGEEADEVLFVSDVVAELDAAREADLETALSIRDGNAPVEEGHGHREIQSLDELK